MLGADKAAAKCEHNKTLNNVTTYCKPCQYPTTNVSFNATSAPDFDCTKHLSAADTGVSHNYNTLNNIPKGSYVLPHQPMQVVLPNSQLISLDQTILLPEPKELSAAARVSNTFQKLTEGS